LDGIALLVVYIFATVLDFFETPNIPLHHLYNP
jgi:hypothetical protein